MQQLKYKRYGIACLVLFAALSCSKMDSTYERFIKDGPIVYPGRVDSVQAFAGNRRALLTWAIPSDQNITSYKVFWNFGADSLSLPGTKPAGEDSVRVYIDSLHEGTYNFTVYSYDKDGHRSVGTNVTGSAYGPVFLSTISNRPIRTLKKDAPASSIIVAWVGLDSKCLGTKWVYTGNNGLSGSFFSPVGDSTIITSCDVTQPVSYQSLFLPEPTAIDTFYTDFKSL